MNERNVLEISLWVFTVGFLVKGIIFGRLAWVMRHRRDDTPLGKALRWHYISLQLQAFVLAFLYLYYATLTRGWDDWLTPAWRVLIYFIATGLVIWAGVMGVRLMVAYFNATHVRLEDAEHEPTSEATNERQDIREVTQNDHEVLQLEIEQRQRATENLQDARQTLQETEQRRQFARGQALNDQENHIRDGGSS